MATLIVPDLDEEPWPTLGPQLADLLEDSCIFGPGSLQGQPAKLIQTVRGVGFRLAEEGA